jgi:Fic family protein
MSGEYVPPFQITDVIDGKRELGPPRDIREVKNAYDVYDAVAALDPCSVKDLLRAHKMMMEGLVKEAGMFRSGNVGANVGTNEEKILLLLKQDGTLTAKVLASFLTRQELWKL